MRCLLICVLGGIAACAAEDIQCEAVEFVQTKLTVSKTFDVHTANTVESASRSFKLIGGGIVLGVFILLCVAGSPTVVISTAIFLDLFLTTVNTPLAPTLTSSYGWIALLTASKNVVTCMIAPLAGGLIDSNESVAMQVGMFLEMLCTLCLAVKNYWFWLAVRCISGVSTAGIVWGGFALCNQIHAKEADARRKAMAMASCGIYAGVILGPQVGGLFVDETHTLFLLLLGLQLCAFLAIRFRLSIHSQPPTETQTESKVNMMTLLLDPGIRNPVLALMMALGFIASLGSTAFEYMARLGYSQMKQNFTWLMVSVPAIIFVYLVPFLRNHLDGMTLQTLAMCLAGSTALLCFTGNYILLSMMFLGASIAAGVVDANTPALLADQSHAKYGGPRS